MLQRLRDLWSDRRGVSAIEFAILGPPVLLLVAAVIEAGFVWSGGTALESGSRAAARYGLTGRMEDGLTRSEVIRRIVTEHVCPSAVETDAKTCFWSQDGPFFEDEGGHAELLRVALTAYSDPRNLGRAEPFTDLDGDGQKDPGEEWTDVNGNGRWDPDTGVAGAGGPADLVVYDLAYHQAVINPLLRAAVGGPTILHETRFVIRNEPF